MTATVGMTEEQARPTTSTTSMPTRLMMSMSVMFALVSKAIGGVVVPVLRSTGTIRHCKKV